MPPPEHCNKCKVGRCQAGDSWCIGCSSLELVQTQLKRTWGHPGIRAAAEESILGAARLVKAFSNLDRGLSQGSAEPPQGVTPKSKARDHRSRSPRRDCRPPLPKPPSPPRRASSARGLSPKRSVRREPSPVESEESLEESEEEPPVRESPHRPADEERVVKSEQVAGDSVHPGSRPPPEPRDPSRRDREARPEIPRRRDRDPESEKQRRRRKKKKKKVKKRAGRKHQRHWREVADPFRRSHRPLSGDTLALARSFRLGLARRI